LQAPALGVAVEAWNEAGEPVVGEVGELVIRRPMPSMPITLWNDPGGERLRDTYFSTWPGVWRHGDYISFDEDLSSVISGRSDSTLNRKGVRIGPAELYAAVEALPEVREALVIGIELDDDYYMPLFVDLAQDVDPDAARSTIVAAIRSALSPRHVPDEIVPMPGIPHTRTGKKLEVPVKRLLQGEEVGDVVDRGSVDDPAVLEVYARFAVERLTAPARHGQTAPSVVDNA
jgi:acetoacetyl-CoA synthetase